MATKIMRKCPNNSGGIECEKVSLTQVIENDQVIGITHRLTLYYNELNIVTPIALIQASAVVAIVALPYRLQIVN